MLKSLWNKTSKILLALLGGIALVAGILFGRRALQGELDEQDSERKNDVEETLDDFHKKIDDAVKESEKAEGEIKQGIESISKKAEKGNKKDSEIKKESTSDLDDELSKW